MLWSLYIVCVIDKNINLCPTTGSKTLDLDVLVKKNLMRNSLEQKNFTLGNQLIL